MIVAITLAIFRSWWHDRAALIMGLVAPVVLFVILSTFYGHLGTDGSSMPRVVIDDHSGTTDGARFADALSQVCEGGGVSTGLGALARVTVVEGFQSDAPELQVDVRLPLPGARMALDRLIEVANARAFGSPIPAPRVNFSSLPEPLERSSAVGLALLFMMFSLASLIGRGLGDHEAGLGERLAGFRVGALPRTLARTAALAGAGFIQLSITLAFALLWQRDEPANPVGLLLALGCASTATAATLLAIAGLCRTSARFSALAPLIVMSLGVASGAMVPTVLMPESFQGLGAWLFTSWSQDAMRTAIDGAHGSWATVQLSAWSLVAILSAAFVERHQE